MESKIQATLCPTRKDWDELTFDLYYWREVPAAEYDDWVDRFEALDQKIETFFAGAGYVLGTITYWRDRTLKFQLHVVTDGRLYGLQELLVDEFRDWRIAITVWLELDKPLEFVPNINESEHLGTVLIGYDFFIVSGGLADYFPCAVQKRTGRWLRVANVSTFERPA